MRNPSQTSSLRRLAVRALGAAAGLAFVAACSDGGTPSGVETAGVAPSPISAVVTPSSDPLVEQLHVCKEGPAGTYDFVANASPAVSPGGTNTLLDDLDGDGQATFSVDAGTCHYVALAGGTGASVTVEELPHAGTLFVEAVVVQFGGTTVQGNPATATVSGSDGAIMTFYNEDEPVDEGCTYTQGYWKNHTDAWPVDNLDLGGVNYSQAQLLAILNQPVKGNGLVALAHQLIAAKLNEAGGASGTSAIGDADALIGALVVPPVGGGFLAPSATSGLVGDLSDYNEGLTGPGHCDG